MAQAPAAIFKIPTKSPQPAHGKANYSGLRWGELTGRTLVASHQEAPVGGTVR
jgi:hypothetical protein